LIALAWVPNDDPANKLYVNHLGFKTDYNAKNLVWSTSSENNIHAIVTGRRDLKNQNGIVVERYDQSTNETCKIYRTFVEAANDMNCSPESIRQAVLHGRKFKNYFWKKKTQENDNQQWMPLKECDGIEFTHIKYSISSNGNIRNDKTNRILKAHRNLNGYENIGLYVTKGHKQKMFYIQRLMLATFNKNIDSRTLQVDHINSHRDDNNIHNLQYLNSKLHATKTKGIPVMSIDADGKQNNYSSIVAAANHVGCHKSRISTVLNKPEYTCRKLQWVSI
jgi:hypothetical protein